MRRSRLMLAFIAFGVAAAGDFVQRAEAATPVVWCGTEDAADRPDTIASHLIHVVYAVPADGQNRFSTSASGIATDLSAVTSWWLGEDAARQPRWDLSPFPACAPGLGNLDISSVRLARPSTYYQGDGDWRGIARRIANDLHAAVPGDTAAKKYLVYYDGPVDAPVCGVAPLASTRGGTQHAALVLTNRVGGCETLGDGSWLAITAAHELIHTLGAVLFGAPHLCVDGGHVCDDARDVMYAGAGNTVHFLADRILDVGHDDYYAHSGSWWDVQDSLWLIQNGVEQSRLDVRVEGAAGNVTSDPAGIDCQAECGFLFNDDAVVTLQASPLAGTRFRRWEGACAGSSSACRVTLDASKTVVASFAPPNTPPTAAFSAEGAYRPMSSITFTSSSSDDGSIANAFWSFGDATIATGLSVTHAFARSGAYTIRLTVVDDEGAQSSIERTVTIVDNRPSAKALSRSARRGALLRLPYRASDDVELRRANVQIFSGSRLLASTTRSIGSASYSGYVTWRAPKRRRAALRWCVRAWDSAGQPSLVSCARLRIR
jgi:hypothetical protein